VIDSIFVAAIFSPGQQEVCPYCRAATSTIPAEESVFWNGRINLVGPRKDAALQVEDFAESCLTQEVHASAERFPLRQCATISRDESSSWTAASAPEREQMSLEIADLVLVGLANIENE